MGIPFRRGLAALAASACVVSLAACASDDSAGSQDDEVRILVSAPLSGDSAVSGQDLVDGAKMAALYLNEQGGVQSGDREGQQFAVEGTDDQLDTAAATSIASRFAGDEKYFALTGFMTSGQAQAAGVVLDKFGLGLISAQGGADFLIDEADNIVVMPVSVASAGYAAADFAAKDLGATSAASIAGDYSFLETYHRGLNEGAEAGGVDLPTEISYPEGTADFSSILTRVDRENPDVVMTGAFQSDAGKIAAQMRKTGMTQPLVDYLGEGWSDSFSSAAGSALGEGEYYSLLAVDAFPEEGSFLLEMQDRFEEEFGRPMTPVADYSFDSVMLVAAAIEAGASDRTDFIKFVPDASGTGVLGPIQFTDDLTPSSRPYTFSKVTGPNADDRELVARYVGLSDGSAERQ